MKNRKKYSVKKSISKSSSEAPEAYSKYFVLTAALFVTCLITANVMAVKLISLAGYILPAAVLIFPVSYIVGDVLTEVYGYRQTRQVIWLGFFCNLTAVAAFWLGGLLPPAGFWDGQEAYNRILGAAPRMLFASFAAYLSGEFSNAFVLAKMKIATRGRWLWARTIASTIVGQGLDSLVFITLAFAGTIPPAGLVQAIVTQWLVKSAYEALATPLTYKVVNFLKSKEEMDAYDHETRFNPFLMAD
ncbi:MAG: queuosine precursor transporter [Desulfococcaceae bacterium]